MFDEVTASSLQKYDIGPARVGSTKGCPAAGDHPCRHIGRKPEINSCSAPFGGEHGGVYLKCGLLPITQAAAPVIHQALFYHKFGG
jgi:hypothetical protein